ncbi:hypothetical protein ElyMa_001893400 [Elysia marginata]|uniref:Uncharacterized protein n=1 Tax=Elysia marginata TaxID=1093978 RepID=A0AAV4EQW1_9GAST|nr:hypothetical protein ElyMa_001893400 [Elysia marginata]
MGKYARFNRENTSTLVPLPCDHHDPPIIVTEQKTRRALTKLNINLADDGITLNPGCSRHAAISGINLHLYFQLVSRYINHTAVVFQTVNNRTWAEETFPRNTE